ncbi:MAG: nuclear transport factor 2 family protein [Myxococcales bacterium]|nr:nuclear transport factor 2 family protein [Myxococcales bacterium]
MTLRLAVVPLLVAAALALAAAQDESAPSSAAAPGLDAYLAAYASADFDALAGMLAPEACFEDGDTEHVGREAVLAGLRQTFDGVTIDVLEMPDRIHGGQRHVLCSGRVVFRMDATPFGFAGQELNFDMPMAIALKYDARGRVVRHVDYVDSDTWTSLAKAQLATLAEKHG